MDTLLVAIAAVGAITVLSAAVSGLAALARRLGTGGQPTAIVEPVSEVANPA